MFICSVLGQIFSEICLENKKKKLFRKVVEIKLSKR